MNEQVDWTLAERRLSRRNLSARCGDGPVGCPVCRVRYRFGDACPTCDVLLVDAHDIDVATPVPDQQPFRRTLALWQVFRIGAPTLLAALGAVSWLVNRGVLDLPQPP